MDPQALIALIALGVTLAGFLAHFIFQSGRLTARVEGLEKWRDEFAKLQTQGQEDMKEIRKTFGDLRAMIEMS